MIPGIALLLAQLVAIEGKVVDSSNNLPIEGARVIMVRTDRGPASFASPVWQTEPKPGEQDTAAERLAVDTGRDGTFRFLVVAPVKLRLFVGRAGYVRTPPGSGAPAFEAKPGVPRNDIEIRLQPEAGISGRVMDVETREPVAGLWVTANVYRLWTGAKVLTGEGRPATTDKEGHYHLKALPPGNYYLEAGQPLLAGIGEPKPVKDFRHAVQRSYAQSWYPGVEAFEQSAPISLLEGGRIDGIDFRIAKRRTAAIRGRLLGEVQGEAEVMLTNIENRVDSGSQKLVARGRRKVGSEFEIDKLLPGAYWLLAQTTGENPATR